MAENKLLGSWKLQSNELFDEYMEAMGVALPLRLVGKMITNEETISKDGNNWTIKVTSTFRNQTLNFKLGEEFQENTMDGRTVKSVITLDGEKLHHLQTSLKEGEPNSDITREVLDDGRMLMTLVALGPDVTARRHFIRI